MDGLERKETQTTGERVKLQEQQSYFADRLAGIDREVDRLKTLYITGLFTLEEISKDKKRLDLSRTELEKQLLGVEARLAGLGVPVNIADRLMERVRAIKQKAAHLTDGDKREILELLDMEVVLYTRDKAPWCHIEVSFTGQKADLPVHVQSPRDRGACKSPPAD